MALDLGWFAELLLLLLLLLLLWIVNVAPRYHVNLLIFF